MGIIDLHFHESKIEFAPHVGPKGTREDSKDGEERETERSAVADRDVGEPTETTSPAETVKSSRAAQGVGALVALAFLVGVGVLVRKVGGGEEEATEPEETESEEGPTSIDVSDD